MGIFEGILICTDLDGTLLNSAHRVSEENLKAIRHFEQEGGKFTFIGASARLCDRNLRNRAPQRSLWML